MTRETPESVFSLFLQFFISTDDSLICELLFIPGPMDEKHIEIIRVEPAKAAVYGINDGFFIPVPPKMEFGPHMDLVSPDTFA
jgi:hypothetical protein